MLEEIELYAWIGEDEYNSGEIGIKQALVPAGMIPLVATKKEKVDQDFIKDQLDKQGNKFGKKIRLCRFKFDGVVTEVGHTHCSRYEKDRHCASLSPNKPRAYCGDSPCLNDDRNIDESIIKQKDIF